PPHPSFHCIGSAGFGVCVGSASIGYGLPHCIRGLSRCTLSETRSHRFHQTDAHHHSGCSQSSTISLSLPLHCPHRTHLNPRCVPCCVCPCVSVGMKG